jgi:transcription antitermination factor NusA-like protein
MKLPICVFCAQTGMLCKDCKTKLASDEIDQIDVEIAKEAVKFEKNNPTASDVVILETIKRPNRILIKVNPGDKKELTGDGKSLAQRLEKRLGKKVIFFEKGTEKRTLIDIAFKPAIITGINTVFLPLRSAKPGKSSIEEETVIVLDKEQKSKLPEPVKDVKKLVKKLTDEEIRVQFR